MFDHNGVTLKSTDREAWEVRQTQKQLTVGLGMGPWSNKKWFKKILRNKWKHNIPKIYRVQWKQSK